MLVEGGKAAEYIKQALRTTLWSGGRVNGIIKSKWFHPIFWARKSGESPFTFMIQRMRRECVCVLRGVGVRESVCVFWVNACVSAAGFTERPRSTCAYRMGFLGERIHSP